jgi:DNA primase
LVDDGKSAKYLNSPETPLFDKSRTLYGLDKAKSEIRRLNYTILVEGQMDLVMSHQVGIKNTIATSGTALTAETSHSNEAVSNLELVRRLSPNVILAFDADKAGRLAAMRAVATTAISMGMAVKVADIEGGKDPADLVRANPEDWKEILRGAKHVVEYELGNVFKEVSDSQKIARAIRERVFPYLARMDSAMDQAHFVKMISEKTHISEDAIWQDLRATDKALKAAGTGNTSSASADGQRGGGSVPGAKPSVSHTHTDLIERRMMGLLYLIENSNSSEAAVHREQIQKIAENRYPEILRKTDALKSELLFEAESFFGSDASKWPAQMKELILHFEENIISEELIKTMHELRVAEKAGESEKMGELAKKCQVLSVRKAEIGKKRRQN